MNGFQKTVLTVAVIILIITLVFIGVSLSYASGSAWPPIVPECPDYWTIDGSGNNTTCVNVKNLGTCVEQGDKGHQIMNFNDPVFSGSNGNCAKYKWADKCNVSWDGISYGVKNPCDVAETAGA
jgi:hypothetical protein